MNVLGAKILPSRVQRIKIVKTFDSEGNLDTRQSLGFQLVTEIGSMARNKSKRVE